MKNYTYLILGMVLVLVSGVFLYYDEYLLYSSFLILSVLLLICDYLQTITKQLEKIYTSNI